jgi:nitronate monooxygenase
VTLTERLGLQHPILLAPMAGGPTTPALAAAVSNAGGLGSLAGAYSKPEEIDAAVAEVRRLTKGPFAINLFAYTPEPVDPRAEQAVVPVLEGFRRELKIEGPARPAAGFSFEAQLEAVLRAQPAVFSFTFGTLSREQLRAVRERKIFTMGTATTLDEALALVELGVDAICAQGAEAGGHRGTFLGRFEDGLVGMLPLVAAMVTRVRTPVIAAGGIMDGRGIRAALALGAQAVQLGTAFLLCPEAGTSAPYRQALQSDAAKTTVITRAFSGRAARGIRNRFTDVLEAVTPPAFPRQQELTKDIRAAATSQGRTDLMQLWAGQGAPMIRAMPAGELVQTLLREAQEMG